MSDSNHYSFIPEGYFDIDVRNVEIKPCQYCGAINELHAYKIGKCEYCGGVLSTDYSNQDEKPISTLTITREKQFFLVNPPASVNINGVNVCNINSGETITIDVIPNMYRLECKLMGRVVKVDLDMKNNKNVSLRSNRGNGNFEATVF